MKDKRSLLFYGESPEEYSRIPHVICLADFNTNYPNTNRIDRIASEINEYLKHKRECDN